MVDLIPGNLPLYFPFGTIDGKIITTNLAKNWQLLVKWGSPCGMNFQTEKFIKKHPQYTWLYGYLKDILNYPWTTFSGK